MILALGIALAVQGVDAVEHPFVYVSDAPVNSVSVAGTFNSWNKDATPMTSPDHKHWSARVKLPVGKHYYKFVVDGTSWITDPKAASNEPDGNGNTNSLLVLMPNDYVSVASSTDGNIALSAVKHVQEVPYLNWDRGNLRLTLRVRPDDVASVGVRVGRRDVPMAEVARDDLFALYSVTLPWNLKSNLAYKFVLKDGGKTVELGSDGIATKAADFVLNSKTFKPFVTPGWVEKTVFYQIFPDRFENGDKTNDIPGTMKWGDKPTYSNRFGGDVAGVAKHLDHLSGLGISGVYFNPVFLSPSNHRYDATDYKKIAPDFGTNEEFARLTKDLSARGIRTVMDFVFNHTATNFAPFQDIRDKGEASKFKDWYTIKSYPVKVQENPNYVAWYNYPSMPKLNVVNPEVQNYFWDVLKYWTSTAMISGMRLDVANEVDTRYWQAMRPYIKGLNKDMWIVGEVWGDGSPWLKGDQWDSVMNYQFRDACLKFFATKTASPSQFMGQLMRTYQGYAPQVSRNMMNLLSSHDTPRFLTLCNEDKSLAALGTVVQMTWVGAPSVYYGEEIGMVGGADPDNRRGMEWDKADKSNATLNLYKSLISIRNRSTALQSGDVRVASVEDKNETVSYTRQFGTDLAVIALNRSVNDQAVIVPLSNSELKALNGKQLIDSLSGSRYSVKDGSLSITLHSRGAAILLPVPKQGSTYSSQRKATKAQRLAKDPDSELIRELSGATSK